MADIEFFEVWEECLYKANVDAVVADNEFAKAGKR